MKPEIEKLNILSAKKNIISNVTGEIMNNTSEIKNLLIQQIESKVNGEKV